MAHRKLLRHAVEFDLLSSSAAPRDFESSKKHAAKHKFSPSFSSRYGSRAPPPRLGDSQGGSSPSTRATTSANAAVSSVSVFMFILLPVVFLLHCCCCNKSRDSWDTPSLHSLASRRRRRASGRRSRRVRPDGTLGSPEANDRASDFSDVEREMNGRTSSHDLDDAPHSPKPASIGSITSLPWCVAGDESWRVLFPNQEFAQVECIICCDAIEKDEEARVMECVHVFHSGCIKSWLKISGTCPACRQPVKRLTFDQREEFWRERERVGASDAKVKDEILLENSPPPLSAEDDVDEKVDDPAHSECEVVYEVCESGGCGGETW